MPQMGLGTVTYSQLVRTTRTWDISNNNSNGQTNFYGLFLGILQWVAKVEQKHSAHVVPP